MEKKYFFFDIDGTLTDRSTGQIVPSAAEAVRKLKEAGHFVSIATGRACYKADRFRRGNGCDELKAKADYVAAENVDDGIYKACEENGWFEHI